MTPAAKAHVAKIDRQFPEMREIFGPKIRHCICVAEVYGSAMGNDPSIPFERVQEVAADILAEVCEHYDCYQA